MGDSPHRAGWRRRGILRALAFAPAALAGCAGPRGERGATDANAAAGASAKGGELESQIARPPSAGALAAIRAFPLPADAEPAFVFRAAARPREPR